MDEERRNQKDSIWWKDLCAVCGAIEEGKWFNNAVRWKLGSGKNISVLIVILFQMRF